MNLCLCGHTYYVHGPACGECEGCREFREEDASAFTQEKVDIFDAYLKSWASLTNTTLDKIKGVPPEEWRNDPSLKPILKFCSIDISKRYYRQCSITGDNKIIARWIEQSDFADFPPDDTVKTMVWEAIPLDKP
mgnify:CR=1